MREKVIILCLGSLVLGQSMLLTIVAFSLHWNRAMITQAYCVNMDEPELMCAGSCYIDAVTVNFVESESESPAARTGEEKPSTTLFYNAADPLKSSSPAPLVHNSFVYRSSVTQTAVPGLFRPPRRLTV